MRANSETVTTQGRTWFLTLTLSPEAHFKHRLLAYQRLRAKGEEFDRLDAERQFRELVTEANREITLYLKRVRKESGAPLRYCLVAERHKSGLPHFHALLHEVGDGAVRAKTLKRQWRLGFSQCKLVAQSDENKAASYVAKYLSKSAAARVRASKGYGQQVANQTVSHIEFPETRERKPPLTHRQADRDGLNSVYGITATNRISGRYSPEVQPLGGPDFQRAGSQAVRRQRSELFSSWREAKGDIPDQAEGETGLRHEVEPSACESSAGSGNTGPPRPS